MGNEMGKLLETCMLACFGASWPVSIYKSYTSRTAKGKSFLFVFLLLIGYIFGTAHKIFYERDFVIVLYILNLIFIAVDMYLYFRNQKLDEERDRKQRMREEWSANESCD